MATFLKIAYTSSISIHMTKPQNLKMGMVGMDSEKSENFVNLWSSVTHVYSPFYALVVGSIFMRWQPFLF